MIKGIHTLTLFFVFTIIGTLLHECGHVVAGYLLALNPSMHYSTTSITLAAHASPSKYDQFIAAGVISTIGTGTAGFLCLRKISPQKSARTILIMLSFFWSQEVFVALRDFIIKIYVFPSTKLSDEQKLSASFGMKQNSLTAILGITGLLICAYVVKLFIPKGQRCRFISYGVAGCVLGYLCWFKILGPYVLP